MRGLKEAQWGRGKSSDRLFVIVRRILERRHARITGEKEAALLELKQSNDGGVVSRAGLTLVGECFDRQGRQGMVEKILCKGREPCTNRRPLGDGAGFSFRDVFRH